jgi:L-ascorbate metabolism protein UlaG (beta-lactamase superfamily)
MMTTGNITALFIAVSLALLPTGAHAAQSDVIETSVGPLTITFIGHGTLMMDVGRTVIHIDPWSRLADYATLPGADIILVTHQHGDHLDPDAIAEVRADETAVICPPVCAEALPGARVLKNGTSATVHGITVEAVAAYNIASTRPNGIPYHPKDEGNGYIVNIGDTRVYIAGDTEYIPEMDAIDDIDIAFLPVNLPYTMTPEMCVEAARAIGPGILYPYHYGETDTGRIVELLAGDTDIAVRIRDLK